MTHRSHHSYYYCLIICYLCQRKLFSQCKGGYKTVFQQYTFTYFVENLFTRIMFQTLFKLYFVNDKYISVNSINIATKLLHCETYVTNFLINCFIYCLTNCFT